MDPGDDDSQSYFAASNPPKKNGLGATLDELKLLQQHLMSNRDNGGSPSRGALLQQPNVLIPSTGAGKYWYVDPAAPAFNPMTYAPPAPFGEHGISAARDTQILNEKMTELYGNLGPNVNQLRALEIAKGPRGQDRPDAYAEMRQNTPGMVDVPTMDLEGGAEGTSIHEIDGKFYILPTQVNGQKFNPVERFRNTGEHLGVFNAEDDASIFEEKNLKELGGKLPDKFQLLPANSPKMLMRTKELPRFAGERDDLLRDTENTFYGGGHGPAPTPKPTPIPPTKFFPVSYFT